MKKSLSVTAFILAVLLLLSAFLGCQKVEEVVREMPQIIAEPTQPAVTTAQIEVIMTEPVKAAPAEAPTEERFTVKKSSVSESLLAGSEEDSALYEARTAAFLGSSGVILTETVTENLTEAVRAEVLSGQSEDLLLLNARTEGAALFCAGFLQDLSAVGIGISAGSDCAVTSLAQDLAFGGKQFLLPYRGLTSDIASTFALSVRNGTNAAWVLGEAFRDGSYCLETVMDYLKAWEEIDEELYDAEEINSEEYIAYEVPAIGGGSKALEGLLTGTGGFVMVPGEIPQVNLLTEEFAAAFTSVSAMAPYLSDREEKICITLLSERTVKDRTLYPVPPISSGAAYVTPVDPEGLTVIAAPQGLVYGQRSAELLALLSALSADLRQIRMTAEDLQKDTAEILFSTAHLELGRIYTWGNLYDLAFDNLGYSGYGALKNTSDLSARLKVAAGAAKIVAERYS